LENDQIASFSKKGPNWIKIINKGTKLKTNIVM